MTDRLLSARQIADLLGVTRQTAYAYTREAGFPEVAIDGIPILLWRESEVVSWRRDRARRARQQKQVNKHRRTA